MKAPVLVITDDAERAASLRRSALSGRPVHLWVPDATRPPEWSIGVRGRVSDPSTFAALRGQGAIVLIDLADTNRARRAATAARRAIPGAPVLIIDRRGRTRRQNGRGVLWVDEGELLGDALESMLGRTVSRRRVQAFKRALRGASRCAFLVQHDPDPDAIASALALRTVLGLAPEHSPIVTRGRVTRPENKRLLEELGVTVHHVSTRRLARLGPLVLVDVQPPYFGDALPEVAAVIDHHPVTGNYRAIYRDVRTSYGASATIAAEYVLAQAEGGRLSRPLATALLYGIITDTKSLSRSASDDDLQMFAYLFPRADHAALRRIQHPSYRPLALRRFGVALQRARVRDGLAYVHLGRLPPDQEHIVAQLAEFCLGMDGAEVSAVSGVFGDNLVMSMRALRPEAQLGQRLRSLFLQYGSAGGHPVMAKTVVKLAAWRRDHPFRTQRDLERDVFERLRRSFRADGRRGAR